MMLLYSINPVIEVYLKPNIHKLNCVHQVKIYIKSTKAFNIFLFLYNNSIIIIGLSLLVRESYLPLFMADCKVLAAAVG